MQSNPQPQNLRARFLPKVQAQSSVESQAKLATKGKGRSIFNKWWIMGVGITINHAIGAFALLFYPASPKFYIACVVASVLQLWGITAGYHRLWSHGAYRASVPVRVALAVMGTASWQGSIKWWVVRHRMHHRFTDTALDPYDSSKGLWFSHCGWLFEKPTYQEHFSLVDMSDLKKDKVVAWNTKWYPIGVIFFAVIFPVLVGAIMGDALQGFLWIGVMSRIVSWNGIFLVNSVSHWAGHRWYNCEISATGSLWSAVLSNGEGNHNFHHEFPKDYRHGYRWCDYDPTKWLIWTLAQLGLVSDLQTTDAHLVQQSVLLQEGKLVRKSLDSASAAYALHMASAPSGASTPDVHSLPTLTMSQFRNKATKVRGPLFLIQDYVVDASGFEKRHPGGSQLLRRYHGKDATKPFVGGRNVHTPAAHNLMARYRVAKLELLDSGLD